MEEIQVTARRRVERDIDIPISVKALDSEMLRQQNIVELNDLGTQVPALRISNAGTSTNNPIISLRGQRPTDLLITNDQAVPMYINDVVITPSEGSNLALYDLQSIQVIKGPQGTLFGRNSTGGTMLITTTRPGTEFGGYMEAKAGDYNLTGFEGAVDIPVNDALQFRLAGRFLERDGYQDNVANNKLAGDHEYWDENSKGARLTMNLELDRFSNLLTMAHDENDMIGRAPVIDAFNNGALVGRRFYQWVHNNTGDVDKAVALQKTLDADEIQTDVRNRDIVRVSFVSNTSQFEINDHLSVKSVLGYRNTWFSTAFDADGTAEHLFGAVTDRFADETFDPPAGTTDAEQFSAELQLIGDAFDGRLQWLAGLYRFKMQGTYGGGRTQVSGAFVNWKKLFDAFDWEARQVAVVGDTPGTSMTYAGGGLLQASPKGDVQNDAKGIFGEATFDITDQWSTTLGLRYSEDDRKVAIRNYSGKVVPLSGVDKVWDNLDPPSVLSVNYSCKMTDENEIPYDLPHYTECERKEHGTFSEPTWRFSVNFTPVDGMLLYGSVATGYRAGGFNMRGTNNATLVPFTEETVLTYEIGHKMDWSLVNDWPLRTNLAVYQQHYDDIQRTQQSYSNKTSSFGTETINAAKAVIEGTELDVTWMATDQLTFTLAYAYTHTYFEEWEANLLEFHEVDVNGCRLLNPCNIPVDASSSDFTYIPDHSVTFSVNYTLPIDPSYGDISLMASVYWQSEMDTHAMGSLFGQMGALQDWTPENIATAESTLVAEHYEVVNVRFDWRSVMGSDFDFALYSNNVTDEEYVVGGLNVIDLLGIAASTYGPPRTIGASVRYNF